MICSVCGQPGKFSQYPGNVPFSDCWCDDCYRTEGQLYYEYRLANPGKKPAVPLLTQDNIHFVKYYKQRYASAKDQENGNNTRSIS